MAPVEGLQEGWGDGSKGDQGVHKADILLVLQMEAAAIGGLEMETSRGKEIPNGFEPAVGEQEAILLEWQLVKGHDRTHFKLDLFHRGEKQGASNQGAISTLKQ